MVVKQVYRVVFHNGEIYDAHESNNALVWADCASTANEIVANRLKIAVREYERVCGFSNWENHELVHAEPIIGLEWPGHTDIIYWPLPF